MKEEITRLENELRQKNISVAFESDSVIVKSDNDGVQEAKNRVDALVKKLHKKTHSIEKPGLFELIRTDRGQNILKQMEKGHGVVICIDDEHSTSGSGCRRAEYTTDGGRKVIATTNDITALNVDVIVNEANKNLENGGELGQLLVERGERSIQDECDEYVIKHGLLAEETIFSSGPGTLKCRCIIHVVCPVWKGGIYLEEQRLSNCVKSALVETDLQHYNSIAFPALNSNGYPIKGATKVIIKGVRDYFKVNIHSSIHTVYLCDENRTTVDLFVRAVNKYFGKVKGEAAVDVPLSGSNRLERFEADSGLQSILTPVPKHIGRVDFIIYFLDEQNSEEAIDLIDKMVEDLYTERSVNAASITEFQNDQLKVIQTKLTDICDVEVTIDTKAGKIKIKGLKDYVSDALSKINCMIDITERVKYLKQKVNIVSNMVQWYYYIDEKDKPKEYPPHVNLILESAFKDLQKSASFFDTRGKKYIVDLDNYVEYPADDPTDKVQVLRKSKLIGQAVVLPDTWDSMEEYENLKIVRLKPTDEEYINVAEKFMASIGNFKADFVSIDRIQNKTLYIQFRTMKKMMEVTNPKTVQNERELWYEFPVHDQKDICTYGFSGRYLGKYATPFGAGVYFTVNASYSKADVYSKPDNKGHKRILLCRVLTGEYTNGNSKMGEPPEKPDDAGSHILYDSVTDNVNKPAIFVIFHDSQAYPEYIITFKRKSKK